MKNEVASHLEQGIVRLCLKDFSRKCCLWNNQKESIYDETISHCTRL